MSTTKSTTATRPAGPKRTPAAAAKPVVESVDEAIANAQHGRVNVTPAKAIEMAGTLFRQGKFGQAEKVCRQIIQARPSNADAQNILGVTLNALGQRAEAIETLQRAVKLAPRAASIHANLGEILRQNGDLDLAAEALQRSIELDPNNAQALNNLGIIHYERRKFKDGGRLLPPRPGDPAADGRSAQQPRQRAAPDRRHRRRDAGLPGGADPPRALPRGLQ